MKARKGSRSGALHILFVCTGNICRSPIAERLATAYALSRQISGFTASSAGTRAVIAHPMHVDAAAVLSELGGDPAGFLARQINSRIASDADLILTMTRAHRDAVLEMEPRRLRHTFTLGEAARLITSGGARTLEDLAELRPSLYGIQTDEVADPLGRGRAAFVTAGHDISRLVRPLLDALF